MPPPTHPGLKIAEKSKIVLTRKVHLFNDLQNLPKNLSSIVPASFVEGWALWSNESAGKVIGYYC